MRKFVFDAYANDYCRMEFMNSQFFGVQFECIGLGDIRATLISAYFCHHKF